MTRGKLHTRGTLTATPRHHHATCDSCSWRGMRTADTADAPVAHGRPCPRCGGPVHAQRS